MTPYATHKARSVPAVLAALWMLLIAYASLYPLSGWRMPPGVDLIDLMRLPWQRWIPGFDTNSNLLGYLPLGLLLTFSGLRGQSRWRAVVMAVAMAAVLSYAMELLQQFVPRRVPSALDWALNCIGALLGAILAAVADALGWPARWRWLHDRWLERGGTGAAALLLLWPMGLLFPSPLPFGLGQVGGQLHDLAVAAFDGVAGFEPMMDWLDTSEVFEPATPRLESVVAVLGLLAPCLLAYSASAPTWRRIWLCLGAPVLATATATLSTALNFGPEHALAWSTPSVTTAVLLSTLLSLLLVWIGPRLAGGLALVTLTGLVVLVHQAPADPYFAQSLQSWEQGTFIRFHGLAQWIGWLWPYAAIGWLLSRMGSVR